MDLYNKPVSLNASIGPFYERTAKTFFAVYLGEIRSGQLIDTKMDHACMD